MLSVAPAPAVWRRLAKARPAPPPPFDWETPIDRSRWFVCETLTPLFYTSVYRDLPEVQRRRYNQLAGLHTNEVIALLESEFLDVALAAVERAGGGNAAMCRAIRRFRDDEARHAEVWARLNRLSEPAWYATRRSTLVVTTPLVRACARTIAGRAALLPVVLWIQLAQEERSVEISRRCLRVAADRLEPRYRAVHAAHLRDEVRHLQIDRHLIECFHRPRNAATRALTARLVRAITRRFLLAPGASSAAVVARLAAEFPDLAPLLPRIRRELRAVGGDAAFQHMMYSRDTTPVTFALFDRFPEFHQMQHVLQAYRPRPEGTS